MIDERKIFKTLWEHHLYEHAPISKYLSVLSEEEINYLLHNGYMETMSYKDMYHYRLTEEGNVELEIYTFGVWKYIEVKFLHLIGRITSWLKKTIVL